MVRTMKQWVLAGALTAFVAAVAWAATAVDGKWSWKQMGQNGEVSITLELKADGEKLTGTYAREGSDMKTPISDGKIKDNDLSFDVVREFNGNKFTTKYKGKLNGDAIKGSMVRNFNGEERTTEWTANRAK
jgi:hypothetical protein